MHDHTRIVYGTGCLPGCCPVPQQKRAACLPARLPGGRRSGRQRTVQTVLMVVVVVVVVVLVVVLVACREGKAAQPGQARHVVPALASVSRLVGSALVSSSCWFRRVDG